MRGFNYPSWWKDEYASDQSAASLTALAGTGSNYVAIIPTWYMTSATGNTVSSSIDERTATDAAVVKAIQDAHGRGLKVLLKPHVDVQDDTSRVFIQPADITQWFASYQQMVNHYAAIAQANNVELFAVGTELAGIDSSHYQNWASLIASVRSVYNGPLTYAASLNDFDSVCFFGLLDYLGLDMYFPLSDSSEPSVDELMNGWSNYHGYYGQANWMARIEAWQARWNKQVIFTELGYRSIKYVGMTPWDFSPGQVYDGYNQARAYEAAFQVLASKPWVAGVFFWDWAVPAGAGGTGNTDYVVRGKPAEEVVNTWFSSGAAPVPSVQVDLHGAMWASYADYLAGKLTVVYGLSNVGSGQALQSAISASHATSGVQPITPLPLQVGTIASGAERDATVAYMVPAGVASFRVLNYVSSQDATGTWHVDPHSSS